MSAALLPLSLGLNAFDPNARSDRPGELRSSTTPNNPNSPQRSTSTSADSGTIAPTGRASDSVTLSAEAKKASQTTAVQGPPDTAEAENKPTNESIAASTKPRGKDGEPLTDVEVKQVQELKARDAEVRRHEQAHVAAGGPYVTSGPSYSYQQGPDGKRYAVGGSVGIDTSPEDTPEATITKAQTIRRAALAPAEPSSQDRRVAAQASQMEQQARAELATERQEQAQQAGDDEPEQRTSEPPSIEASANTVSQLEQAYTSTNASTFSITA
ncbi:MAG: putative metalloprotease CJM1_0395 family protein [Planctomycetota bacterium]